MIAEIASIGLSIGSEIAVNQVDYAQAQVSIESIDKMLENLARQKEELSKAYGTRKEIATDIYGNKVEDITYKARRGIQDVNKKFDFGMSKSDLAYSGTLYEGAREGKQSIEHGFTSEKKGLENQLGQTLADIMITETKDYAGIENTMAQLEGQKDVLEEQKSPGENILTTYGLNPIEGWIWGDDGLDLYDQIGSWF